MEKLDIVETVRREGFEPIQKGRAFWMCCAFHIERTPSQKLDPVRQSFYCFGCGAHGDAISFIQRLHNLSFKDALRYLRIDRSHKAKIKPEAQTKRDLVNGFRQWERDYYNELCAAYKDFHAIAKDFKTIEEVEFFAEDFDLMPVIEWHMDILVNGSEEDKYGLYCLVKGKDQ